MGMGLRVWGESLGFLGVFGGKRDETTFRFAGENETVAAILGGGVCCGGGSGGGGDEADEEAVVLLDLGAKKREITCCFCFPIEIDFLSCVGVKNVFIRGFGFGALSLLSAGRAWRTFQNYFFLIILTNASRAFNLELFFFKFSH